MMRIAVTLEERSQQRHVGDVIVADHHRTREVRLHEPHAPEDQRAQDTLTEVRLRNQQRT